MVPEFLTPYDVVQILRADNNQKWLALYPNIETYDGCSRCVRDQIDNGHLRMVVKLWRRNEFLAVRGHHSEEDLDASMEVFDVPFGWYVSASDNSDQYTYHPHLYDHDGSSITLVEAKMVPIWADKATEDEYNRTPLFERYQLSIGPIGERRVASTLFNNTVKDAWMRLYSNDTLRLLSIERARQTAIQTTYQSALEPKTDNTQNQCTLEKAMAPQLVALIENGTLDYNFLQHIARMLELSGQKTMKGFLEYLESSLDERDMNRRLTENSAELSELVELLKMAENGQFKGMTQGTSSSTKDPNTIVGIVSNFTEVLSATGCYTFGKAITRFLDNIAR
ncbi:hypothetical protein [Enterovibrio calviensis]|uniref:hypothetical protein n=1 Tax=Enterovibrio calviensis TaxID=91359 RepID=UPI0037361564